MKEEIPDTEDVIMEDSHTQEPLTLVTFLEQFKFTNFNHYLIFCLKWQHKLERGCGKAEVHGAVHKLLIRGLEVGHLLIGKFS